MEIKNFLKYILKNKCQVLKLAVISILVILVVFMLIPKYYERIVYMHIPYEYESRQINEIIELIKADKNNEDWISVSVVKNANLIKFKFKGKDSENLIKNSDEYLYEKIMDLSVDYENKIKEIENAKKINHQLEYSLLQGNRSSENVNNSSFTIEYADTEENQSEFPPTMYKQIIVALVVGSLFSFIVFSIRYILCS